MKATNYCSCYISGTQLLCCNLYGSLQLRVCWAPPFLIVISIAVFKPFHTVISNKSKMLFHFPTQTRLLVALLWKSLKCRRNDSSNNYLRSTTSSFIHFFELTRINAKPAQNIFIQRHPVVNMLKNTKSLYTCVYEAQPQNLENIIIFTADKQVMRGFIRTCLCTSTCTTEKTPNYSLRPRGTVRKVFCHDPFWSERHFRLSRRLKLHFQHSSAFWYTTCLIHVSRPLWISNWSITAFLSHWRSRGVEISVRVHFFLRKLIALTGKL